MKRRMRLKRLFVVSGCFCLLCYSGKTAAQGDELKNEPGKQSATVSKKVLEEKNSSSKEISAREQSGKHLDVSKEHQAVKTIESASEPVKNNANGIFKQRFAGPVGTKGGGIFGQRVEHQCYGDPKTTLKFLEPVKSEK